MTVWVMPLVLVNRLLFEGASIVDRGDISTKHMAEVEKTLLKGSPWNALFNALDEFSPDFMDERQQPEQRMRKNLE